VQFPRADADVGARGEIEALEAPSTLGDHAWESDRVGPGESQSFSDDASQVRAGGDVFSILLPFQHFLPQAGVYVGVAGEVPQYRGRVHARAVGPGEDQVLALDHRLVFGDGSLEQTARVAPRSRGADQLVDIVINRFEGLRGTFG